MALRKLGIKTAPVIFLDHLTDEQRRAYMFVHNKLTMNSGFDYEMLLQELEKISSIDMAVYEFKIEDREFDVDALFDDTKEEVRSKDNTFVVVCPNCGHENMVEK